LQIKPKIRDISVVCVVVSMLIRFVDKEEKKMKTLDDARVVLKKPRRHDRGGIRPLSRAISTYHNS
jgi:hypothetical protein